MTIFVLFAVFFIIGIAILNCWYLSVTTLEERNKPWSERDSVDW